MINEQELAEAVERLREGDDNGLLVKQEEVFKAILRNERLAIMILESINEEDAFAFDAFEDAFKNYARDLLREAYRTKLEHEAGY